MDKLGYLKNKVERDTVSLIGSYIHTHDDINLSGFFDFIIEYDDVSNQVNDILMHIHGEPLEENEFYDILKTVCKCIDEDEIKELKNKIKNEQDEARKVELIEKLTELKKGCGNNEGN